MRKITIAFSLWLSALGAVFAQSQFPLSDAIWEEETFSTAGQFVRYRLLCGDTTINEQNYAKIYDISFPFDGEGLPTDTVPPAFYAGGLRADGNEVFYVEPGGTEDLLLYDFSLEAEESIELPNTTLGNAGTYNVTNVDTIKVNGEDRRRIFLESVFGGTEDVWVEGVGSVVYGLLDRGLALVFDYGSSLNCLQLTAEGSIFRPDANGDCRMAVTGCGEIISSTIDRSIYAGQIQVYPNPSPGTVNIRLPRDGANWQIELWSLEGKFIEMNNSRDGSYDWSHLPRGTYLLQFIRDGRKVYSEKLIIGR
ncbi:T9SS type A sorting domain-containing protein [Flavilitoribacter nigricans]|uniref:Secretion system C-terminal sorting domain-containing protein n=1 Tax=Flavilitoribacter nigricans (strain ATCC 23147 / DSM 23189 / NBRC 102662 / NCIMB 1420 / SS-2) TaxID=1122177 RepID=A0A2D0N7G9_FLAN2|nr:T9SS type A sorting domain-containing protein [Flavilitoribacter nigricans]PHN04464.1 hypothetical protein CRP01_20870 [Flavilitoribacter nigricans DSM 23189 = NBRC 102662]